MRPAISEVFPIVVFFWMRNPIMGHDNSFWATVMTHNISCFLLLLALLASWLIVYISL